MMSISGLINDINAAAAGSSGNVSEEERKQLLQACEKLQESLENPFEKTMRILLSVRFSKVSPHAALNCLLTLSPGPSSRSNQTGHRHGTLQCHSEEVWRRGWDQH